jgi:hypothetical protein
MSKDGGWNSGRGVLREAICYERHLCSGKTFKNNILKMKIDSVVWKHEIMK